MVDELSHGQTHDWRTHTHTHTHAGNDNTRRPKLASGKNRSSHIVWQSWMSFLWTHNCSKNRQWFVPYNGVMSDTKHVKWQLPEGYIVYFSFALLFESVLSFEKLKTERGCWYDKRRCHWWRQNYYHNHSWGFRVIREKIGTLIGNGSVSFLFMQRR